MAISRQPLRALLGASALALSVMAGPSFAETIFTEPAIEFQGQIRIIGAVRGDPLYAGGKAVVTGARLVPGQEINVLRGTRVLNEKPIVVDEKGNFQFEFPIDAEAKAGLQPIVISGEKPASATVAQLKISTELPVSGAEKFTVKSAAVTPGLYQVIYSPKADAVFVAASVGRPPIKDSALVKINPETLAVEGKSAPADAPAQADGKPGGVFAVYGVEVDDANGNIWVSNTRQDTVAVYKQSDLSLVKQFEAGTVGHSRDIVVDETNNRAYASTSFEGVVKVFDTVALKELDPIQVRSKVRGKEFGVMSLDLDEKAGKLVTVSINTPEAAIIDLKSGAVKVFPLPGVQTASGAAYDAKDGLIFVASQDTDNLLIVNAADGKVVHDVKVGAGALNVTFEPVNRLAYVANRGSGTITVVNTNGEVVANLAAGSFPNQLRADGKGNVWAVNKSRGDNDDAGDKVWKITPVK